MESVWKHLQLSQGLIEGAVLWVIESFWLSSISRVLNFSPALQKKCNHMFCILPRFETRRGIHKTCIGIDILSCFLSIFTLLVIIAITCPNNGGITFKVLIFFLFQACKESCLAYNQLKECRCMEYRFPGSSTYGICSVTDKSTSN